ncbi:MAG: flavodoxin family protein [Thermodesulfobacteriota bacterium]|nr:flavodoxin family protein [Thermodesulfobacteriota bacterium]
MDNTKKIVIYDSFTKNTSEIANTIADHLDCRAVTVSEFKQLPAENYGLIVMGSPVLSGKPTKKIIALLNTLDPPEKCAVFCTFGAPVWGLISSRMVLSYIQKQLHAPCIGTFSCPGLHAKFKTYKNRPDTGDIEKARQFAEKIAQKV